MVNEKKNRTLVIGLDGATWKILQQFLDEQRMPNLQNLIDNGTSGITKAVLPINSMSSWASFATGKNPGKHSVFDFRERKSRHSTNLGLVSSSSIQSETLWHILSRHGKLIGVMNVPVTYPPETVNGLLISGMLTPSVKSVFTYPPSLYQDILENVGDYVIDVPCENYRGKLREFIHALQYTLKNRAETVLYLMNKVDWDFFMVVFVGTDRLQHFLWEYIDPEHPKYDEANPYRDVVAEYFQTLDGYIGQMLELINDNTAIIVLSDHGFQSSEYQLGVNQWLAEIGLLKFRRSSFPLLNLLQKIENSMPRIRQLRRKFIRNVSKQVQTLSPENQIDWKQTKAYYSSDTDGGICINLKGREAEGIVEGIDYEKLRTFIKNKLMELVHPESGEKVVEAVFMREELYSGPFLEDAPDIVFIPKNILTRDYMQKEIFIPTDFRRGDHEINGIFISKGQHIVKNGTVDAEIIDLTPTILYSLGIPIPKDMDGKVLTQIFTPQYTQKNPIEYEDTDSSTSAKNFHEGYSDEEYQKIEERLRSIGYI